MQGFEERYTRHMKTVALVISIAVVVMLNANFFAIHSSIKSDPVKTALIVQQAPTIIKTAQQENGRKDASETRASDNPSPTASPLPSPSAVASAEKSPSQSQRVASGPPLTTATESPSMMADVKKQAERVDTLIGTYESFGIQPLSRQQIINVWKGKYRWRDLNETIVGWAIMVMLLSAGAPFWQDTLESLFGSRICFARKARLRISKTRREASQSRETKPEGGELVR
jgi:hypothetical protein